MATTVASNTRAQPSHSPLGRVREQVKSLVFRLFEKVVRHDEGRRTLWASLDRGGASLPKLKFPATAPYADLPTGQDGKSSVSSGAVFITARFRSGSTLLWNIFRHLPDVTAYYEPLNERRWFDRLSRGEQVDSSHRHASDYWREYDGLESLAAHYRVEWIDQRLYMDDCAWDPALKRYIEALIVQANGRAVLQFNRVDFRLPWLRRHFPDAKLLHLYRNPRDQWISTLVDMKCCGPQANLKNFEPHDKFYLLRWARDLKFTFPFLDERSAEHPYELFYFIWKLSYLFGVTYADHSIAFEDLISNPAPILRGAMDRLDMPQVDLRGALEIVEQPAIGKWREYAPDEWFRTIESRCERTLGDFLGSPAETRID